ncbi:MAG TPA: PAS domain S-box protein [Candidatus Sulfopaludibacter sp.]|nr:PAS domain S-box protein [Candidatus Sulfopaludibacter sp.]
MGQAEPHPVSILVVNQSGYRPVYVDYVYGLRPILTSNLSEPVLIYQENLNFTRFGGDEHRAELTGWLHNKYRGCKLDVIVASGRKSLDFVLQARPIVWPQVPVVAMGNVEMLTNALRGQTNITGLIVDNDVRGTLATALRLCPDTRRIAFISPGWAEENDASEFYQHDLEQAEIFCSNHVQLIKLVGLNLIETKKQLAHLPVDTVVFYDDIRADDSEPILPPWMVVEELSSVSKSPIFSYSGFFVGYGVAGGMSLNRLTLNSEIASQITAVIRAGNASAVPLLKDHSSRFVFDWRQIQKFGMSGERLPSSSEGRFRPPTLWQAYHTIVIIVLTALAVQTALILALLWQRRRMRQTEEDLSGSQRMLRTVLDTIPHHVIWKDRHGAILGCNRVVMEECGNIVGKTDFETGAANFAEKYRADDLEVMENDRPKLNFEELQTRKDGTSGWYRTSKVPLHDGTGRVIGILGTYDDITELKRAEQAVRESERRMRTLSEASFEGICVSENGSILDVNDQFVAMFGYERNELIGRDIFMLIAPEWRATISERVRSGEGKRLEHQCLRKDGSTLECEAQSKTLFWNDRKVRVSAVRDLTERKELEAQLRQSQKMQAFGQLAAGVAHDFNNILTIIQGNVSLLQMGQLSQSEQASANAEIFRAAQRAANLTRQLLTFSRRQPMQPKDLDLNEVVANITKMLRRLIGEDVALETRYAPGGAPIHADPGMLEQVLMNLAVNARDAMPKGGRLTVETAPVTLADTTRFTKHTARPGNFVRLSITDTGCGVAPEHLPHLFEPFFTTKDVGKGTGLGLATVFGIVEQHQGWIEVESQLNQGTTFHIYFPRLAQKLVNGEQPTAPAQVPGGNETILLVEDETVLRRLMQRVLERHGYHIHAAVSGVEALEIWRERREGIDILVTDMVMPDGMNGRELADRLRTDKPDLKIIFCSGYANNTPGKDSPLRHHETFLEKPFEPAKLLQKIRDCADMAN